MRANAIENLLRRRSFGTRPCRSFFHCCCVIFLVVFWLNSSVVLQLIIIFHLYICGRTMRVTNLNTTYLGTCWAWQICFNNGWLALINEWNTISISVERETHWTSRYNNNKKSLFIENAKMCINKINMKLRCAFDNAISTLSIFCSHSFTVFVWEFRL